MENQSLPSPHGSRQKAPSRLAKLEADNKALQQEINTLRSSHQKGIERVEGQLTIEQAYQESQLRFRTIFEQSKLGNKIITDDLRIIQVNQALQEMLGYSEEELLGTKVIEYAHPRFMHPWRELQKELWTENIPSFSIEACLITKEGAVIWCHVTSIIFQDQGQKLGYTLMEDISERKLIEAKLKKLYDSQEIVTHIVAHDLKNPLHSIKIITMLLKKEVEALRELNPERINQSQTYLHMIDEQCDKAGRLIKDLHLIGEIELGSPSLTKQATEMKSFIETKLAYFQWDAAAKDIVIHTHFSQGEVYAHIDRDKFARVLENLLTNAIKFTGLGGQVEVSLKRKSQHLILQVSDTGIGIPEALHQSVFNKFTKANRQGTQGEETTGLGLFIVKQVVELHKGEIWFESEQNQGTTFYVEIPLQ